MGTIHKFTGDRDRHYAWEGQRTQDYGKQPGIMEGTVLHWLIGKAEGAPTFAIRYFEIPPGGSSNAEQHPYEHGVIVMRGIASVTTGEKQTPIQPFDIVYIAPDEWHQFTNISDDETFGAFCTIPAYREKGGETVYAEGNLAPDDNP